MRTRVREDKETKRRFSMISNEQFAGGSWSLVYTGWIKHECSAHCTSQPDTSVIATFMWTPAEQIQLL